MSILKPGLYRLCSDKEMIDTLDAWNRLSLTTSGLNEDGSLALHFQQIPPDSPGYGPCRRMWALNVCCIVERDAVAAKYLEEVVNDILKNSHSESHPSTCPCKAQIHFWRYPHDMSVLEPLHPAHMSDCCCRGFRKCIVNRRPSPLRRLVKTDPYSDPEYVSSPSFVWGPD